MSGLTPYMAAAWKAGVDDGNPTDMKRRMNRPLVMSRWMLRMPPLWRARSNTLRDSPSIWMTRNRRRGAASMQPRRVHRARRSTMRWKDRTRSSTMAPPLALPGHCFAWPGDPDGRRIEAAAGHFGSETPGRLVVRLPGQHERAPMYADEALRAEVAPSLQRLLGRDVHGAGDLARSVGADGEGGQIEGPQSLTDLLEVGKIARVPCEIEALRAEHGP